jgi:hypothetical protein
MSGARRSSASIATHYGLDCVGFESWWGLNFPHTFITALGPNLPPTQWVPGIYGVKWPGRGFDQSPRLQLRLKK